MPIIDVRMRDILGGDLQDLMLAHVVGLNYELFPPRWHFRGSCARPWRATTLPLAGSKPIASSASSEDWVFVAAPTTPARSLREMTTVISSGVCR